MCESLMDFGGVARGLGGIGEDIGTGLINAEERKRQHAREDVELEAEKAQLSQAKQKRPLGQPMRAPDGKYYQILLDPTTGNMSTQEIPLPEGTNVEVMNKVLQDHISKAPKELQEDLKFLASTIIMERGDYGEAMEAVSKITTAGSMEDMKEAGRQALQDARITGQLEGRQTLEAQRDIDRKEQIELQQQHIEQRMVKLQGMRQGAAAGRTRLSIIRAQMLKSEIVALQSKINQLDASYAKQTFDPSQGKMVGTSTEAAEQIKRQKGVFYDEIADKQTELNQVLGSAEALLQPSTPQPGATSSPAQATGKGGVAIRWSMDTFFSNYNIPTDQRKQIGGAPDGTVFIKGGVKWLKQGSEMVRQQ